jgi:hypothetical protein
MQIVIGIDLRINIMSGDHIAETFVTVGATFETVLFLLLSLVCFL